jgi:hypothetical protein
MRVFVGLLFSFLILVTPAWAFVIGVSPTTQNVCVAAGENASITFMLQTAGTNRTERLSVSILNLTWVTAASYADIPPAALVEFPVFVSPPAELTEGMYAATLYICAMPPEASGIDVVPCLMPEVHVNVSSACAIAKPDYTWLKSLLLLTAAILIGIFFVRARPKTRR